MPISKITTEMNYEVMGTGSRSLDAKLLLAVPIISA